jgi:hypothetical protein
MTRFDAADPTERRKLFADAVTAHRERGSAFLTLEAEPTDGEVGAGDASEGGDDEEPTPPPWVQFADETVNLDCTDDELSRLKSLLDDYPEFRIDELAHPEEAEGTNVRVTARADANRLADFVDRVFVTVYERPDDYRVWAVQV